LPSSPASSYRSATPTIPPIRKWTVAGLRKALENADIQASRKMHKAELYDLYVSLQATPKTTHRPCKSRTARNSPVQSPPPGSRTRSGSLHQSTRRNKPSASLGRPLQSTRAGSLPEEAQPSTTTYAAAAQYAAGPSSPPTATRSGTPAVYNPFPFQWPPAPLADASAKLPTLAEQAQPYQQSHPPDGQRVESNRSDEEMEIEKEKEGNVEAQVTEREQGTASQEKETDARERLFSNLFGLQHPTDRANVLHFNIKYDEAFNQMCDDIGPCQPVLSFPKNVEGRSFQKKWYENNPWLEYSPSTDAMFYFSCRLFLNN
ncbi:hypothetical protein cypCar_00045488, partial [Cyprinus carpio]